MKKVLFLDTVHPILQDRLEQLGYNCLQAYDMNRADLKKSIADYFGIVLRSRITMDQELLQEAEKLNFIARSGAGMENIDLPFAEKQGIHCFNSPEGNMDAVGEHALGMLLMLFNKLFIANIEAKKGIWKREENRGIEVSGKTIGIIGFGNMGSAFAKKLKGLDCKVIAYDKYKKDIDASLAEKVDLHTLFEKTDILSIHVPLTDETHFMIDKAFIDQFKNTITVINTSRGSVLKTKDLVDHLKSGKVFGACLDVLEYEKKSFEHIQNSLSSDSFNYLAKSNRVILSPHVAGWTEESYVKLSSFLADKIEATFGSSSVD